MDFQLTDPIVNAFHVASSVLLALGLDSPIAGIYLMDMPHKVTFVCEDWTGVQLYYTKNCQLVAKTSAYAEVTGHANEVIWISKEDINSLT